jgi:hypothetical protein
MVITVIENQPAANSQRHAVCRARRHRGINPRVGDNLLCCYIVSMERDISDVRLTAPIALAFGISGADCCLVRHTRLNGLMRVYAGTRHRMVELSVYSPIMKLTILCQADAFTGMLFKTVWDRTTQEVARSWREIDVDAWSYPVAFGIGQLRHPFVLSPSVKLRDQGGERDRLLLVTRMVKQVLEA